MIVIKSINKIESDYFFFGAQVFTENDLSLQELRQYFFLSVITDW